MVLRHLSYYLISALHLVVSPLLLTQSWPWMCLFIFFACYFLLILFPLLITLALFFSINNVSYTLLFYDYLFLRVYVFTSPFSFSVLFLFVGLVWSLLLILLCAILCLYLLLIFDACSWSLLFVSLLFLSLLSCLLDTLPYFLTSEFPSLSMLVLSVDEIVRLVYLPGR